MRILDRYVLRELFVPFCIGIAVGVLLLVGTLLVNFSKEIFSLGVAVTKVGKLLLFKVPDISVIAMPMAMAFAASLAVNRMTRQREITALRIAGVRFGRIVLPIAAAGLLLSGLSYFMAEKAAPWANVRANRILREIRMQSLLSSAEPNVYVHVDAYTFYIGSLSRTPGGQFRMTNLLAYQTLARGAHQWLVARSATAEGRVWTLDQVVRRRVGPDGMTVSETHLTQLPIIMKEEVDFASRAKRPEEMTRGELLKQIRMLRATGGANTARTLEVAYHNRFALPLSCLVFALLASPLSFHFARGGTFVGVLVSVICGFFFWNIMILSNILATNGVLPTLAAAWVQNVGFGALAIYLIRRIG